MKKKKKQPGIPVFSTFLVEQEGQPMFVCQINPNMDSVMLFSALGTTCKLISQMYKEARRKAEERVIKPNADEIRKANDK